MTAKVRRINMSLGIKLVDEMDDYCSKRGLSRSSFVANLVSQFFSNQIIAGEMINRLIEQGDFVEYLKEQIDKEVER